MNAPSFSDGDLPSSKLHRRAALRQLLAGTAAAGAGGWLASRWARAQDTGIGTPMPSSAEIEKVLLENVLPAWYPRTLDETGGGFYEDFARDWTQLPTQEKFIVYQARLTWTASIVAIHHPTQRGFYLRYARHGLEYLRTKMWDEREGGFFELVAPAGGPAQRWPAWKQLYGQAFGIYAAATEYAATSDRAALDLAVEAFRWLDAHAHDAVNGGYDELLTREGQRVELVAPPEEILAKFPVIGRVGEKSMNAHIHLLEALTALVTVWNDPVARERLDEVFRIVRDRIVRPEGHLAMFTTRDFQPTVEQGSYGHQLETAFLLDEASRVAQRTDHAQTGAVAVRLVDHAMRWGWDSVHGGFANEGPAQGLPTNPEKVWWVQAEALNGLLTADYLTGGRNQAYRDAMARTWMFFRNAMLDTQYGDCYEVVEPDGRPIADRMQKANRWKANYHLVRALLVTIDRLSGRK